jgi:hypothetical protein
VGLLGKRFYGKKGTEWIDPSNIDLNEGLESVGFGRAGLLPYSAAAKITKAIVNPNDPGSRKLLKLAFNGAPEMALMDDTTNNFNEFA